MIKYTKIAGDLPPGLTLTALRTNGMLVSGTIPLAETYNAPLFNAPFSYTVNEKTAFSANINPEPHEGREIVGVDIISGYLPFGLTFENGVVSGTTAELVNRDASYFTEDESPVWVTDSGSLGSFGEKQVVSLSLNAGNGVNMVIKKGYLPIGLTLSASGQITGTTQEIFFPAEDESAKSTVVWGTPRGALLTCDEGQSIDLSITATGLMRIVKGGLPFGLTITPEGRITGTVAELPFEQNKVDIPTPPPTITGVVPTQGKVGQDVSVTFTATPSGSKTILSTMVDGYLPTGLVLINGVLSGKLTSVKTNTFKIVVTDSDYRTAEQTYTIEVTE